MQERDSTLRCPCSNACTDRKRMQNICILCSASAEIQLRVLAYSSETAKEFFSFYKLLGLRGLLKIFFWSSSSPPWVFQFILLLMVWNWVLLGLGTWSLLPSAQRNEGKSLWCRYVRREERSSLWSGYFMSKIPWNELWCSGHSEKTQLA